MDVWTYFEQKEKEFASLSLEPEPPPPGERSFVETAGSNGKRGRVLANLILAGSPVNAFIAISEKPAGSIPFKKFAELAWEEVSRRAAEEG
jgi:hypothetical protein